MHTKTKAQLLLRAFALLALIAMQTACKQQTSTPVAQSAAPQQQPVLPTGPGAIPAPAASANGAAGLAWTVPSGWELAPARQMRVATYRVHAIAGDPEDAECAVYFFGAGQGGTVEANLDRWAHQFTSPSGQSPAQPAKMETRTINGLKVSTLAVSGTYLGAGGMMGQAEVKKPNFRMRAAIVEAPQGLVFFKLTGPLNTVASAEGDFTSLLGSVQRQ
jgi:hypothetical protein